MAKRGREPKYAGLSRSYYKKAEMCYCNYCGKQMYIKDVKIVDDPKGVLKELKLCEKCYTKQTRDFWLSQKDKQEYNETYNN